MKFYEKEIEITKELKEEIRNVLKAFDVRIHFVDTSHSSADMKNNLIHLSKNNQNTLQWIWSCVFHELCHILCHRQGLYKKYHHYVGYWDNYRQFALYMRRYGLRAERFVDKKAGALMKIHFPNIPFVAAYDQEHAQEWYKKWVKRNYPLEK